MSKVHIYKIIYIQDHKGKGLVSIWPWRCTTRPWWEHLCYGWISSSLLFRDLAKSKWVTATFPSAQPDDRCELMDKEMPRRIQCHWCTLWWLTPPPHPHPLYLSSKFYNYIRNVWKKFISWNLKKRLFLYSLLQSASYYILLALHHIKSQFLYTFVHSTQ